MKINSMKYYNSFWYRFTRPIKRVWFMFLLSKDKLIKVDDRHRGIGKTYMMIGRSIKKDIPIIVGNNRIAEHIKRNGNPVDIIVLSNGENAYDLIGKRFPNGIMIDESLDPKMISVIASRGVKIRGGFIYNRTDEKW